MVAKRFVAGLLAAVVIVGSSFTALAAPYCLNVRDYGCHNYHHRYRGVKSQEYVNAYVQNGCIHAQLIITQQGECVCGEWGTWLEGPYTVTIPIN